MISDETFEYITGSDMTWGGFNWKLNFRWYPVPQREMERRGGDRSLPLRSVSSRNSLYSNANAVVPSSRYLANFLVYVKSEHFHKYLT